MRACVMTLCVLVVARPGQPDVISESDFLAGIGEGHPAFAALGLETTTAEAALRRARTLANPRLEAVREKPSEDAGQTTVVLGWVPPIDGRRGLAIRSSEATLRAAERREAARRLALRLAAREAFAQWAATERTQRQLAENASRIAALARRTRARARAGEESSLTAMRLELAASEASASSTAAGAARDVAGADARAYRPDLHPDAEPELPPVGTPERHGQLVLEALAGDVESARLEERLAARFWLAPELQAGWQRIEQGAGASVGAVVGLTWAIPIFDRNHAARAEAGQRRRIAEARHAWATARARTAVSALTASLEALRRADEAAEQAARVAPGVVRAAIARFEAGEATVTELMDSLSAAIGAELRATDARLAALEAQRRLEGASAALLEGEIR